MIFCECENSRVHIIHLTWACGAVAEAMFPVPTACTNDLW